MIRPRAFGSPFYRVSVVLIVAALTVGAVLVLLPGQRHATVYFSQTKGLYEGDDVKMLGVPIGEITKITPEPGRVRVELEWDADRPVPAGAKAILVSPSLVSVRHVAFTPVYTGGPELQNGTVIPMSRTAVPVEWDQIKGEVNDLTRALGPDGANKSGALNRLLDTSARNLEGRGTSMNRTLRLMSEAMSTISEGSGDFFGTVRNLRVFVDALASADAQVFDFNQRLDRVSQILSGDREELAAAFSGLDRAFTIVTDFLKNNRDSVRRTTADLQPVADMLADERQGLADALQWAPHVISNLNNFYDPLSGSLTGQLSVTNLQAPGVLVCSAIFSLGGKPEQCHQALEPIAKLLQMPAPAAGINLLQRNGAENQIVSVPGPNNPKYDGTNGPGALQPGQDNPPVAGVPGLSDLLAPGGNR